MIAGVQSMIVNHGFTNCSNSAQIQKMAADEEVLNQNTRLDLQ